MLAAFLKSIGFIIPLMDSMYANYYTREVMVILIREFQTPDEEMKKIVLKVTFLTFQRLLVVKSQSHAHALCPGRRLLVLVITGSYSGCAPLSSSDVAPLTLMSLASQLLLSMVAI